MSYRKYHCRRRKQNYPQHRRHDLGLADELGHFLAELLADFGNWITRAIGRVFGNSGDAPPDREPPVLPDSLVPAPAESKTAPVRSALHTGLVTASAESLPYRKVPALLTKGERAVWHPLYLAVKGRYRLFCKVRLADMVHCPPGRRDESRWFRKIGRYQCDFVIRGPHTTAPLLVVDFDNRRHRQPIRKDRDSFKDEVLLAADMPIYRIAARQAYDPEALNNRSRP